jgi:uncharacterized SAM-binding protein YcdF (DUF218 family)
VFVVLSKTLDLALDPVAWAIALGALAVALRRRAGAALGVGAVAVLWAFSTGLVSDALGRAVEAGVRDTSRPDVVYDAVLVLGGAGDPEGSARTGRLELNAGADRVIAGYELLHAGRARVAVFSAGPLAPTSEPTEAALAVRLLAGWGIEPSRLVAEERARNTRENAIECARIARERGWTRLLVVTSAAHMPRALGCFRAVGLEPDALPVDWRAGSGGLALARLVPRARSLEESAHAVRELAGRVVYRVAGYSR